MAKDRQVGPLRRLRRAAGFSSYDLAAYRLTELAAQRGITTSTSPNSFGRWERGERRPHASAVPLIAEILGVDPDDLGFDRRLAAVPTDAAPDELSNPIRHRLYTTANRAADLIVACEQTISATGRWSSLVEHIPPHVTGRDLNVRRLHHELSATRLTDDVYGPRAALVVVADLLDEVRWLVPRCADDTLDRLGCFVGQLVQFLGWLLFDLGHVNASRSAHEAASDTIAGRQHAPLAALIHASMAYVELATGAEVGVIQARARMDLALALPFERDEPLLRSYLYSTSALVSAHEGRCEDFRWDIELARDAFHNGDRDAHLPVRWMSEARIHGYTGYGLKELGHYPEAREEIARAIDEADRTLCRFRAALRTNEAEVATLQGDPRDACMAMSNALDEMARSAPSPRIIRRLTELASALDDAVPVDLQRRLALVAQAAEPPGAPSLTLMAGLRLMP